VENFISNINSLTGKNLLFNSFEDILEKHYPVIKTIKEKLDMLGIKDHLLSGSVIFNFCFNKRIRKSRKIKKEFKESCLIRKQSRY
jgi:4-diphosphocytidyl-2C-methyl-D-erythritol kinase